MTVNLLLEEWTGLVTALRTLGDESRGWRAETELVLGLACEVEGV